MAALRIGRSDTGGSEVIYNKICAPQRTPRHFAVAALWLADTPPLDGFWYTAVAWGAAWLAALVGTWAGVAPPKFSLHVGAGTTLSSKPEGRPSAYRGPSLQDSLLGPVAWTSPPSSSKLRV